MSLVIDLIGQLNCHVIGCDNCYCIFCFSFQVILCHLQFCEEVAVVGAKLQF